MSDSEESFDVLSSAVPLATAIASGLASAFLLFRLCRLGESERKRLLVRQLRYLALANLVYLIAEIAQLSLALAALVNGMRLFDGENITYGKNITCVGFNLVSATGSSGSLLLECHMAVAFLLSIMGAARAMHITNSVLVLVLPSAVMLAVVRTWTMHIYYEEKQGGCVGHNDYVCAGSNCMGIGVCLFCYISSSCSVGRAGRSVQRSVWNRAQLYPLVALLTIVPLTTYYFIIFKGSENRRRMQNNLGYMIADSLYDANGLLTFMVYALPSKHVRRSRRLTSDGITRELSWRVNFRGADSIVEAPNLGSEAASAFSPNDSMLLDYYDGPPKPAEGEPTQGVSMH